VRFDGITGAFIDYFVARGSSPLSHPNGMVFGPDGDLYVTSSGTAQVLRYDGRTRDYLGAFVASSGDHVLTTPVSVTFGPDGDLYVADFAPVTGNPAVVRYQGLSGPTPGAFIGEFVPAGSGGLLRPLGLLFGPDGNGDGHQDLYVSSQVVGPSFGAKEHTTSVKRYDGVTGAFIDTFVAVDSGGLDNTGFMVFTETDPTTLKFNDGNGHPGVGLRSANRPDLPVVTVAPAAAPGAPADGTANNPAPAPTAGTLAERAAFERSLPVGPPLVAAPPDWLVAPARRPARLRNDKMPGTARWLADGHPPFGVWADDLSAGPLA
jgi:hypothetical protein